MHLYTWHMTNAASTPPKCSICGQQHWKRQPHRWGVALTSTAHPVGPKTRRREPAKASIESVPVEIVQHGTIVLKVDRKTYLKLKARDRRKRERAEADKLGITVAEYRARRAQQLKEKI
jgi:hypothetical protein